MDTNVMVARLRPIIVLVCVLWAVELVNLLLGHQLNMWFGLRPRALEGLIGVPAMPFLHSGFQHLLANTVPLAVLGGIGVLVAPRRFWRATVAIVIVSGLAVWLFARSGIVVGASGLVFGWAGFILALGALERSPRTVIGALVVLLLYGGMFVGVLPERDQRISWEAHFLGAVTGAMMAYLYRQGPKRRRT